MSEDEYGDETLTTAEAAERIGVTERRVRQLAEFLHATRDEFGHLRYPEMTVTAFANARRTRVVAQTSAERIDELEQRLALLERRVSGLEQH